MSLLFDEKNAPKSLRKQETFNVPASVLFYGVAGTTVFFLVLFIIFGGV